MDVCVREVGARPDVEVVEHKGIGHPDSLCDALAEQLSLALSRFYLERFGAVLHHNVDKALLWGGVSRPAFGGGEVIAPMELFLAGRATGSARQIVVPVEELAVEGSRAWLRAHMHALDPELHVKVHPLIRPGSSDLVDLFLRGQAGGAVLANDTSLGVGYAPRSMLERIVLDAAAELRRLAASPETPWAGEDVKVMGVRHGEDVQLTVACALIGKYVEGLDDYLARRDELARRVLAIASVHHARVAVAVNAADDPGKGDVYLTVTGTSAEAGDDGQVGRGNRHNGLITPYRPMTLEAIAGKNPISHVGKLYSIAAQRLADELVADERGVESARVCLVSRIGHRIDEPPIVDVEVGWQPGAERRVARVEERVRAGIAGIPELWRALLDGSLVAVR